jgi:oligo-1,6-glucosidase
MAKWWEEKVIYQIYPRSFQDSNGDGIGDIPGITSRLDELADLGVGAIWLSPVYPSPNADNGYDISDYRGIHPEYGTMADMEELIAQARARDIKIIMDLVINHTSDRHIWFQRSRDKDSTYRNYYIWRKGKPEGGPPNNWTSFFAEKCWAFDELSGEYYLHLFAKGQPDLNWHNSQVMTEVESILRFWLNKGVAGFRCDVINVLYKSSLEDGKKRFFLTGREHYLSQPGNHEILKSLRARVLDQYDAFTVGETAFITPKIAHCFTAPEQRELDQVFPFEHMETDQFWVKWLRMPFRPKPFFEALAKWQQELHWNAVYLENHDQPRSVSRFGDEGAYWEKSAKSLAVLLLTLRGTPYIYQGQELGMTNFDFTSMDQLDDVESRNMDALAKELRLPGWYRWRMMRSASRDNARTPYQWDGTEGGGFTTGKPWLGMNANHKDINFAAQKDDPESIRSWYKTLIAYRKDTPDLLEGEFKALKITDQIFVYRRGKGHLVAVNLSSKPARMGAKGVLVLSNYSRGKYNGTLFPYEAVILRSERA